MAGLTIAREDPRGREAARLVGDLDAYMAGLYPPQSNHLIDLETLAGDDVVFLVARRDSIPAGCAALWCHGADYGEIKRVWVAPGQRGLRIAQALLAELENAARARRLPLLRLETGTLQPTALSLFAAHGFSPRGPFGDYPADDPYSVFMEKPLA